MPEFDPLSPHQQGGAYQTLFEQPDQKTPEEMSVSALYRLLMLLLFLLGLCSFFLYKEPTEKCVRDPDCAEPMADLVGIELTSTVLYVCGAGVYALSNASFAVSLIDKIMELTKEVTSPVLRTFIIAAAGLFGLIGTGSSGLNAYSNGSPPDEIGLCMGGAIAPRTAKSCDIVTEKIPHFFESIKRGGQRVYYGFLEHTIGLSEEQKSAQKAILNKIKNHERLILEVKARWSEFLKKVSDPNQKADLESILASTDTLIDILSEQSTQPYGDKRTLLQKIIENIIMLITKLSITGFVIVPILLTILESLNKLVFGQTNAQSIAATIGVGLVESSVVYSIAEDIGKSSIECLDSIWNKKPYPNLTYQLYKNITVPTKIALVISAGFSFANVLGCYLKHAVQHPPYRYLGSFGKVAVIFSTTIYHAKPTLKLFDSAMEKKAQKQFNEKKLYEFENTVKKIEGFSPEEAHAFIHLLPPNIQRKFGKEEVPENKSSSSWCCLFATLKTRNVRPPAQEILKPKL